MKLPKKKDIEVIQKKVVTMVDKIIKQEIKTMTEMGDYIEKTFSEREMVLMLCNNFKQRYNKCEEMIAESNTKEKESIESMYN